MNKINTDDFREIVIKMNNSDLDIIYNELLKKIAIEDDHKRIDMLIERKSVVSQLIQKRIYNLRKSIKKEMDGFSLKEV